MTPEITKLRNELLEAQRILDRKKQALIDVVRGCAHTWSQVEPDHIYHKGYMIPGDPPGVGGSDHRFDCYVEPKTDYRWKRTCIRCGEVSHTTKTTKHVTETPSFD